MVHESIGERFHEWMGSLGDGAIAVIAHKNGDMDTIASATVLASMIGPRARATGLHVDKTSSRMLSRTGMEFRRMDPRRPTLPRSIAGIVAVDAGGPSQLGFPLPVDAPLFVVDHHANSSDEWPAHAVAPQGEASSTCEMVLGILLRSTSTIQVAWAEMLYAGIVTDTGRFRHGSPSGLRAAARLLDECWIDTDDVLTTIEGSGMPADQRKRILRSMGGMEIHHCGGLLVTTAKGGSHESRIASSMVGSGADASIVAKTLDGGGLRITTRASQGAVRAGVDLGEVMSSMATTKGGQGGGHAGAAGWSGEVPTSEAFAYILASIGAQARGTDDE